MRNNSTWAPSALSPIPWPRNAWKPGLVAVNVVAIAILAVVPGVAYIVAYELIGRSAHAHGGNPPPFQQIVAEFVTYVPLGAYLVFVLPRIAHVTLAELGIRKPAGRDLAIGAAGAVVMWLTVIVASSAAEAITHHHDTESAVELLKGLKGPVQLGTFVVLACVFAPIIEELTFRVFVFGALTRYVPIAAAAVISGALFGATHAIGQSASQLVTIAVPLALGGIVLAYVYAVTRCFWSNVVTHAAFNAINTIVLILYHGK